MTRKPRVPRLARGGVVPGRWVILGDGEPERIDPLSPPPLGINAICLHCWGDLNHSKCQGAPCECPDPSHHLLPGLITEPPAILRHAETGALVALVLAAVAYLTLHRPPAPVELPQPEPVVTVTITQTPDDTTLPDPVTVRWTR